MEIINERKALLLKRYSGTIARAALKLREAAALVAAPGAPSAAASDMNPCEYPPRPKKQHLCSPPAKSKVVCSSPKKTCPGPEPKQKQLEAIPSLPALTSSLSKKMKRPLLAPSSESLHKTSAHAPKPCSTLKQLRPAIAPPSESMKEVQREQLADEPDLLECKVSRLQPADDERRTLIHQDHVRASSPLNHADSISSDVKSKKRARIISNLPRVKTTTPIVLGLNLQHQAGHQLIIPARKRPATCTSFQKEEATIAAPPPSMDSILKVAAEVQHQLIKPNMQQETSHKKAQQDQDDQVRATLDAARKAMQEKTQKQRLRQREEARAALEAVQADAVIDDACKITQDFLQLLSSTSCFPKLYAGDVLLDCTYASNLDCAGRLHINFLVP